MRTFTSANVKGGYHDGQPKYSTEVKTQHNGLALAVGIALVGLIVFAVTHADLIKAVLGL